MSESTYRPTGGWLRSPIGAILGATAAAIAIWAIASAAGAQLIVNAGSGEPIKITVVNVALAALVGTLAGWFLLVMLRGFTPKARRVWTIAALTTAMLSLASPLSVSASAGTKVSLVAMHLAVATVLIIVL